ncbi:hypothetical protein ACQEWB_48855 [Streptomyces sp. CA-249302]|uniref:hypothetical protein n=1 Tax=Streptomyces sp. CA-249302 TaxID=3240058 RepID=UPI003D8E397E
MVGGLMVAKDAVAARHADGSGAGTPAPAVTSGEYMGACSWDGAIAPYYRLMLSTTHYHQVRDATGVFTSAASCHSIQRAVDNIMRYNDVTDAVADYVTTRASTSCSSPSRSVARPSPRSPTRPRMPLRPPRS